MLLSSLTYTLLWTLFLLFCYLSVNLFSTHCPLVLSLWSLPPHTQDMVHRDLKLENVLLSTEDSETEYNIKVSY